MSQRKRGKRVLVATQQPEFCRSLVSNLHDDGYFVRWTASIAEVMTTMTASPEGHTVTDVVVVFMGDLGDPERDEMAGAYDRLERMGVHDLGLAGFGAVAWARRQGSQVPAVFLEGTVTYRPKVPKVVYAQLPVVDSEICTLVEQAWAFVEPES